MKKYSFNTAYTQARELYGLELNSDEFESIGLIAWSKIGNKQYKLYKYQSRPIKSETGEYYVELPCNVDIIESVTTNYEDYQKTSPTMLAGNNQNGWVEGYIESRKYNTGTLYNSGKFIKYREEDNRIYLSDSFEIIYIIYKGIIVDEEGLPELCEKELDAIAAFCIFVDTRKKAILTRDQATWGQVQYLEQNWLRTCTQARVPEYINQNEMDEILNAASSWDRKRYGRSFKPVR